MSSSVDASGDAQGVGNLKEKSCPISKSVVSSESILICPVLIEDYFMNRDRQLIMGRDHHMYLQERYLHGKLKINLNQGYEADNPRPRDEGLMEIERYLTLKADQSGSTKLKTLTKIADIVCKRGAVTKLASSPFDVGGNGWKFRVEKFQDILFLSEEDTAAEIEWNNSVGAGRTRGVNKQRTYWGKKYRSVLLAKKGEEHATVDKPANTSDDVHAVFDLTFPECLTEKRITSFYCAEMDGLDAEGKHVKLNTQAYELFKNEYFSDKAMKWWIQTKLVGVDEMVVGLRTNKGILFNVKKVDLAYLDRMCPFWDGESCFRAAQHILNEIRQNYDEMVKPGELMVVEKKGNEEFFKFTVVPASEGTVLTPEFKTKFEN